MSSMISSSQTAGSVSIYRIGENWLSQCDPKTSFGLKRKLTKEIECCALAYGAVMIKQIQDNRDCSINA
jgi:hypothetical protein